LSATNVIDRAVCLDFKLCDWCIHNPFQWVTCRTFREEEHCLSRLKLRWSWWISKITMKNMNLKFI